MEYAKRQVVTFMLMLAVTTCFASDDVDYAEAKVAYRDYVQAAANDYVNFMAENGGRVPEDKKRTIEGLSQDIANCVVDALAASEDSDADVLISLFAQRAPELEMGEFLESRGQLSETYVVAFKECFFSAALNNGMIIE